ncbi:unnamed protein product [Pedinophyceae sp. YPF-701]|nr:unnamed protein product [Pedinophyceae sp. YPF-701]
MGSKQPSGGLAAHFAAVQPTHQPAVLGQASPRPAVFTSTLEIGEQKASSKVMVLGSTTYVFDRASPVVKEFQDSLTQSSETAVAVAVINALTSVIEQSKATTIMELQCELDVAAGHLKACNPTAISLKAACELFLQYVSRTSALAHVKDIDMVKSRLIERGRNFANTSLEARKAIASFGEEFVHDGARVLVHGYSRVVLALLTRCIGAGRRFSVVVTEGRPDGSGSQMARALSDRGIPCTMVLDSAVACCLESVDLALLGAEGVVENGGVINKLGTYQIALLAKAHNTPFYVAAESYKFTRLCPLNQKDVPVENRPAPEITGTLPPGVRFDSPSRDYTPPALISLLVTDLGVLTPAAVSDELIQLFL